MKKKKNQKTKHFDVPKHLPMITSVLVILLSAALFFSAKGYTIDFHNRALKKTGVITVNPRPITTDIYIDDELIRKPARSKSVDTGIHNVTLKKEKYHTWQKDVRVLPETTTIITPWMLLQEPEKSTVWESEMAYVNHWINKEKSIALILLQETDDTYTLWKYRIQSGMLDFFDNPTKIWTTTTKDFTISLSPNGNLALLTLTDTDTKIKTTYIINTSTQLSLETLKELDFNKETKYQVKWAKDSKHLILTSEEEILSYNISSQIIYSLLSKEPKVKYIWDTDEDSNFYILKDLTKHDDEVYTYSIEQYGLDGTGETYLISNISLQKDEKYIQYFRENTFNYIPFTNSVISTQTVGQIVDFEVNSKIAGVFIRTTTASYWYDILSRTYMMVNPYPSEILSFSKNNRHFIFDSMNSLHTYTFKKYSENPLEKTGTSPFPNAKKENDVKWVDSSKYLSYTKENTLHIVEKDGDNDIALIPMDNILFYNIEAGKNILTLFEKDVEGNFIINQLRIQ